MERITMALLQASVQSAGGNNAHRVGLGLVDGRALLQKYIEFGMCRLLGWFDLEKYIRVVLGQ